MLTLMQNAGPASGLSTQAEPIAGQGGEALPSGQPQAGFSDALLNVVSTLMAAQGKIAPGIGGRAVDPQDEETAEKPQADASPLKEDAQQQLLQALLMTGQMPASPVNDAATETPGSETLRLQMRASPLAEPQPFNGVAERIAPRPLTAGIVAPAMVTTETLPTASVAPSAVAPHLMTALSAVAPTLSAQAAPATAAPTSGPEAPASAPASTLRLDSENSRWTQQLQSALGERLQLQVKNQIQHATIRLDPPEMGKIDIALQLDNGRVQVQISASHAEVYRALQQTSGDLRQSLTEQNFVQVNVQVSSQSGQQQGKEQPFAQQHAILRAGDDIAAGMPESDASRREDDSVLLTV
ncbi:flagellar hook-length control protein FliK [Intestinirhabdus alba]|nr:flagellar hook-length control protein FliK [Intestinirhabdus alba]